MSSWVLRKVIFSFLCDVISVQPPPEGGVRRSLFITKLWHIHSGELKQHPTCTARHVRLHLSHSAHTCKADSRMHLDYGALAEEEQDPIDISDLFKWWFNSAGMKSTLSSAVTVAALGSRNTLHTLGCVLVLLHQKIDPSFTCKCAAFVIILIFSCRGQDKGFQLVLWKQMSVSSFTALSQLLYQKPRYCTDNKQAKCKHRCLILPFQTLSFPLKKDLLKRWGWQMGHWSRLFPAAGEQAVSIRGQSARALAFGEEFPQNEGVISPLCPAVLAHN